MGSILCLIGFHNWGAWAPTQAVPFRRRLCERCGAADFDRIERDEPPAGRAAPTRLVDIPRQMPAYRSEAPDA